MIQGDVVRTFAAMLKNKSSLSRPKSCSCAAIPICQDGHVELSQEESFVQRDVLDSFQNAVQSLEQSKPSSSLLSNFEFTKQPGDRSSLPNMTGKIKVYFRNK